MRRGRSIGLLALSLAGFGLAAGCRSASTQPPPFLEDGGVFVAADPSLTDASRRLAQGFAAYATGIHHEVASEPALAEAAYREALAADPGNDVYALRLGCALFQQDKVRDALEFVEGFLAEHPGSSELERWLSQAYRETKEWDAAIRHARAAAEADPASEENWLAWAGILKASNPDEPELERGVLLRGTENASTTLGLRKLLLQKLIKELEKKLDEPEIAREIRMQMVDQVRAMDREDAANPEFVRLYALVALQSGMIEEGLHVLERYVKAPLEEDEGATFAALAVQMTPDTEVGNLLDTLVSLRERGEAPPDGWYLQGICLGSLDRMEEAVDAAWHAVAEKPNDEKMWLWLFSFFDGNDENAGYRVLRKALKANPDSLKLHTLMSLHAFQLRRYAVAERECRRVLELAARDPGEPRNPGVLLVLSAVLTRNGRHDEAAAVLREAVEANGGPEILEDFLADVFFVPSRHFRLLAKTYHAFADAAPETIEAASARMALAVGYMTHGQPKHAVREFDAVVAGYPSMSAVPARLQHLRAIALESAGRVGDAVEALQFLVRTQPKYIDPYNSLAYLWAEAGEHLDEALPLAETAVGHEPGNPAYLDTLAWVQYRLGLFEDARENIRLALSLAPGEEVILGHAAAIEEALRAAAGEEAPLSGDSPADGAPDGDASESEP